MNEATQQIEALLHAQCRRLTGLKGLVLAGTDGRPIAHAYNDEQADATAAVSASSLQLARRLADLLGDGELDEIVVRSTDGYVIVLSVGEHWVLVGLTVRSANVAMMNLSFRDLLPELESALKPQRVAATV